MLNFTDLIHLSLAVLNTYVSVSLTEYSIMLKSQRTSSATLKQTKHQQEMAILRAHHERLLANGVLREAALVGSGVFVRAPDGSLVVAKPYEQLIVPKEAA